MQTIEEKANELAYGLGISLYLSPQGRITQNNEDGLSREIRPPPNAKPIPHAIEGVEWMTGAPKADS